MNCTKGLKIKGFKIAFAMIGSFSLALMVTTSVATAIQSPALDLSRAATVKRIGDEVKFLASDELEGRGVNTKGIEVTANYIRDEFKKFGLKSGVDDGSYFQPFEITLRNIIEAKNATFTIKNADVETKLKLATDFSHKVAVATPKSRATWFSLATELILPISAIKSTKALTLKARSLSSFVGSRNNRTVKVNSMERILPPMH